MLSELRACVGLFALLMLLTGFGYPWLMLNAAPMLFAHEAGGGLVEDNGKILGSELIGQNFTRDDYFHGRPSAAGNGYDASNSSGSNLATTSPELLKAIGERIADLKKSIAPMPVPVDLVTASASGLDPDISPAAARFQAPRVADARHLDVAALYDLIARETTPRRFGFLGENRVNVLALNRALDQLAPPTKSVP